MTLIPKDAGLCQQNPFAGLPILAQSRVPLSPKYTVEIKLHDTDGAYVAACLWDPGVPTEAEMAKLREQLDDEFERLVALAQSKSKQSGGRRLRIAVRKNPFAGFPIVQEARVAVSNKYTLELTLHEVPSGDNALWIGWDPHPPTEAEEDEFGDRIDAALAPFFDLAFSQSGRSTRGGEA